MSSKACARLSQRSFIAISDGAMGEVARLHGGVLKSASSKDLMSKVADAVDRASVQVLFQQTWGFYMLLCVRTTTSHVARSSK